MHINWLAYAAAVLAQMIIGYAFFHPALMGKVWAKANGKTVEEMNPKNSGLVYGLTFVYTLLNTMFLLFNVTGPGQDVAPDGHSYHTFQHGLAHALIFSVLVVLPVMGTPALHAGKSKEWVLVQLAYWFVRVSVAFGILSMWR